MSNLSRPWLRDSERTGPAFDIARGTIVIVTTLLPFGSLRPLSAEETVPGLTTTRPDRGRFVKTSRGYMIPYSAKIPGSNVTFAMEPVPGGTFLLGSPADEQGRLGPEGPQVRIKLTPFWMGRHEVTWAEYLLYYELHKVFPRFERLKIRKVSATNQADAVTAPTAIYDPSGRFPADKRNQARHPAVSMTQYGAKQYTKWLSKLTGDFYRLPSEAEWEYACRGGATTAFHFGSDAKQLGAFGWYFDNSNEETHPVGLKKANPWGLCDMHGNAAEWVLDQFAAGGYARLSRALTEGKPPIVAPTKLHPRSVRGGSWDSSAEECRAASRRPSSKDWQELDADFPVSPWWLAADMNRQIGFRIARPLNPPAEQRRAAYWDAEVTELVEAVRSRCAEGRGYIGIVDRRLPDVMRRVGKK